MPKDNKILAIPIIYITRRPRAIVSSIIFLLFFTTFPVLADIDPDTTAIINIVDGFDSRVSKAVQPHGMAHPSGALLPFTGAEPPSPEGFKDFDFKDLKTYNFALVLSGGGSRGLAQIGVLKAIEEEGLRPDLIVTTSMGAIVGGLYACGYSADEIYEIVKSIDWGRALSNASERNTLFVSQKANPKGYLFDIRFDNNFKPVLPSAISSGQIFYDELSGKLLPALHRADLDFKKLPVSLRVVASDLLTGNRVVFSSGSLITAIRASCSVPFAFTPIFIDGKLLTDGGLTANIPVRAAKEEGAAIVVAVDVTSPLHKREELKNPVRLMEQIVSIGVERNKAEDYNHADFIITPQLQGFSNTDFGNIDLLVERGYEAARALMPAIKDKIGADIPAKTAKTGGAPRADSVIIPVVSEVLLFGNEKTSDRLLLTASGIKPGSVLDVDAIERGIRSLRSTELFDNVRIETEPETRVNIHVEEKKYWRVKGGLRYDEYHLGELFLEPGYDNLFGQSIAGTLRFQYGMRKEKYALDLATNHLFTSNLAGSANLQLFTARERIYSRIAYPRENNLPDSVVIDDVVLGKSGVSFVMGGQIAKSTSVEAGIKIENFQILQSNRSIFDNELGFGFRNTLPYFMFRFNIDTRDVVPFTSNGWRHIVTTGFSSDAIKGADEVEAFVKIDGSFNYYFTLAHRHTFHTQAIAGWTSAPLPEVEKFYLGGAIPEQSYRDVEMYNIIPFMGIKPRSVSSEIFGLAHFEYRFALTHNFFLTAAIDWARLWDYEEFITPRDISSNFAPKNPLGVGIGLAYRTPLGPIRFTYGQLIPNRNDQDAVSEPVFYFSAGYDF